MMSVSEDAVGGETATKQLRMGGLDREGLHVCAAKTG
jgi:hypothetical protein